MSITGFGEMCILFIIDNVVLIPVMIVVSRHFLCNGLSLYEFLEIVYMNASVGGEWSA